MKRSLCVTIAMLASVLGAEATHNRAGEITYEFLGGLSFRATITTYTVPESPADRPYLELNWGDGTLDTVPRVNGGGEGVIIMDGVKLNIYTYEHTYPSASTYVMSMEDPNRNGGVNNIPNSISKDVCGNDTMPFADVLFCSGTMSPVYCARRSGLPCLCVIVHL